MVEFIFDIIVKVIPVFEFDMILDSYTLTFNNKIYYLGRFYKKNK